ncbi:hypothetical protein FGG08_000885 [Glutinoglossum americanum]|uniref:Formamidopyrimidine-DNA glycosylase catalytic domain-containing protein n=1 Tax=Glutinoglossum americanum TaxID=1670608 RepID=A0A9P8I817_9PEZI|nr:hypothetical protein FGG08_000885 [Glutinoglossum americanum]
MPEIGEVAKLVHQLQKHLVGKTIASVRAIEDTIVYKDTTSELFKEAITGKKVVDAGQQGKYFWIVMSSPPHVIAHLGMTGWMTFSNQSAGWYKPKEEDNEWPPKHWKFLLSTAEDPKCEVAFTDPRRLGRIRLVDCQAGQIRNHSPLKENGPDPVIDREKLSKDWFIEKIKKKRVPVKSWLLDQANISGVGNWVGDEILYNAKIHPEQYTNSLSDTQLNQLLESILSVCSVCVGTLAEQERFPEEWLMKHRWSKGKKDKKLPNGRKIEFVKVGGRTSAFVPTVQKKTGPTTEEATGSTKRAIGTNDENGPPNSPFAKKDSKLTNKRTAAPKKKVPAPVNKGVGKGETGAEDDDDIDDIENNDKESSMTEEEPAKPVPKKRKTPTIDKGPKGNPEKKSKRVVMPNNTSNDKGSTRRRSTRIGRKGAS